MAQKERSHEISTVTESQFVSKMSQADLNYYERLLSPSLLMNNHCITLDCSHIITDDERLKCTVCNGQWCSSECMASNKHEHYSSKHNLWKYKELASAILDIFAKFDDNDGNGLLSNQQFNKKYRYESIIIETDNNYTISKLKSIDDNTFKAMKTYNIDKGENYNDSQDKADDLLTKWIVMRNLNILKECEIYVNKQSIDCVQKLWDTDLEAYITNNLQNNMFSPDNINTNIAFLMKSIIPKMKLIHSNGLIIGDIKPANLMMNYDKNKNIPIEFGIIDFQCISKIDDIHWTSFGTIHYRPPEMDIRTGDDYFITSPAFDVYSLGISLLEIINGKHPYFKELAKAVLHRYKTNHPNPKQLNGFIDQDKLDEIINNNVWLQLPENKDFKHLLEDMISTGKNWRIKIDEIINHRWYKKYCS